MIPYLILGLGAWFCFLLAVSSCARDGHFWRYDVDACERCYRTGTDLAHHGEL